MAQDGVPVEIDASAKAQFPHSPDLWVSVYGWRWDAAYRHCAPVSSHLRGGKCSWVLPTEIDIVETSYSEFCDTFSPHSDTIGIDATGVGEGIRCECGKYTDVTLRHEASLGEVLSSILGLDRKAMRA